MSKLYAIRQTKFDKYWYDFVEDFTSPELDRNCISNNFTYVKECQDSLATLNPAWKNSEIVEFRQLGDLDDFEDLYYKSLEQRADLEAKLAESESKVAVGRFWHSAYEGKQLDYDKLNNDYNKQEKLLSEVLADKSKLQFEFDQLKQQLAEKDKEIESLKVDGVLNEELEEKDYTIIKPFLKETLTIEEIKHIIKNLSDFNLRQTSFHDVQKNDVIFNAYINKHIAYKKCLDLLDLVDQDKISFAVEQLEKVKEELEFTSNNNEWITARDDRILNGICDFIDNQIKQLKEMK